MCNKKLFTHSLNEHGTQHCSLHSLPHKRQSISATFISNKIFKLPTYHMTHHCSQFLHTRQTIPAMLSSNYPQHNTLHAHQHAQHTPCTSTCTTHSMHINMHNTLHTHQHAQHTPCTSTCTTHSNTLPTTFLNPPMHTTNKHKT